MPCTPHFLPCGVGVLKLVIINCPTNPHLGVLGGLVGQLTPSSPAPTGGQGLLGSKRAKASWAKKAYRQGMTTTQSLFPLLLLPKVQVNLGETERAFEMR